MAAVGQSLRHPPQSAPQWNLGIATSNLIATTMGSHCVRECESLQPQGMVSSLASAGGLASFFDAQLTVPLSAFHRWDLLWRQSVQHCERIGNSHAESPATSPAPADLHSPGEYAHCPESVPGGPPHLPKMEQVCHIRLAHCPLPSFLMPTQGGFWEEVGLRLIAGSLRSGEAPGGGGQLEHR